MLYVSIWAVALSNLPGATFKLSDRFRMPRLPR